MYPTHFIPISPMINLQDTNNFYGSTTGNQAIEGAVMNYFNGNNNVVHGGTMNIFYGSNNEVWGNNNVLYGRNAVVRGDGNIVKCSDCTVVGNKQTRLALII